MEKSIIGNVSPELFSELVAEYGMGFQHWGDVRHWGKVTAPHKARHVTRQGYVDACRRLFFKGNQALLRTDHRLIQAGFNRVSPTVWLGGELDRFLEYWKAAAPRSETVGSPRNPDPEDAYRAMQAGLPAWAARAGRFIRGRKRLTRAAYRRHMNQARALTRMSGACIDGAAGADLLALMGKLPSLWQWAVVHYIHNSRRGFDGKRWRVRDIPWDTLREHLSRKNILGFLDALEPGDGGLYILAPGHFWDGARRCVLIEWLCPSYPKVDWTNAVAIARGMTPVQLSGGVLTKKEAHQWLLDGGPWLVGWLCEKYNIRAPLDHIRSPLVAKWLIAVDRRGAWGQLTRVRRAHGPAGAQGEYTFLQKLDEIQDIDLVNGAATTVEYAFESAAQRVYEAYETQVAADNAPLNEAPKARILPKCSRWLLSAAELVKEGREMQHCVGSYTYAVKEGQCAILALCVWHKGEHLRSTVEFALYGRKLGGVRQHYGPGNTEPHPVLLKVVRQIERMNREYTPFDDASAQTRLPPERVPHPLLFSSNMYTFSGITDLVQFVPPRS